MTHQTQKRLAANILGVGINKVWFDPNRLEDIKEALTKQDIRDLIKDGAIKSKQTEYKKVKKEKKKRRTGKMKKRVKRRKQKYVKLIRKLRKYLKEIRKMDKISSKEYNHLRRLSKAGIFKSKKHLEEYVKVTIFKEAGEEKKEKPRKEKGKRGKKK